MTQMLDFVKKLFKGLLVFITILIGYKSYRIISSGKKKTKEIDDSIERAENEKVKARAIIKDTKKLKEELKNLPLKYGKKIIPILIACLFSLNLYVVDGIDYDTQENYINYLEACNTISDMIITNQTRTIDKLNNSVTSYSNAVRLTKDDSGFFGELWESIDLYLGIAGGFLLCYLLGNH